MYKTATAILILAVCLGISATTVSAGEKTLPQQIRVVYVLEDINAAPYPLSAYIVWRNQLILGQRAWIGNKSDVGEGPRGLAVDSDNSRIFVAHEGKRDLDTIDAMTLDWLAPVMILEAKSPAGLAVDESADRLYITNLLSHNVIVYNKNLLTFIEEWKIPSGNGAFGLSLVDGKLYVGDGQTKLRYYDLNSHAELGNFDIPDSALAVSAVSYPKPLVFTTSGISNTWLTKYDLTEKKVTHVDLGLDLRGVKANPDAGVVYVVAKDREMQRGGIYVIDMNTMKETSHVAFGDKITSPTDCAVGARDFGSQVRLEINEAPDGFINAGSTVTFVATIGNPGDKPLKKVPARFLYDPNMLTLVETTPAADILNTGELGWKNLSEKLSQELAPNGAYTVTATFIAKKPADSKDAPGKCVALIKNAIDASGKAIDDAAGSASFVVQGSNAGDDDLDGGKKEPGDVPAPSDDEDGANPANTGSCCGC